MNYKYYIYILLIAIFVLNYKSKNNIYVKKNILVMFSGGLDSTTALYKLLKETNHNIYAHHIILKDKSDRWKYELKASRDIIKYLKNIRPFDYSESTVDLKLNSKDENGGSRHDDNTTVIFIASQICTIEIYKKIDYIVISNLDCELDYSTNNFMDNMIHIMQKKRWAAKKPIIYDALTEFNNSKCSIKRKLIKNIKEIAYKNLTIEKTNDNINDELFINTICVKKKMYEYLPNYLKNKIIYCRLPKNNKNCNKCFNCILYQNVI